MIDFHKDATPAVTVTLVHGTFARDASWTDEESDLSNAIKSTTPGTVSLARFNWSGGNSHRARLKAGQKLAAHLRKLIAKSPAAKHHVIAHSHGGNVAMYALRDTFVANRISSLVCLATPFITLKRRTIDPSIDVLREFPNPLFACVFAIFVSIVFGTVGTSIWALPSLLIIPAGFWFFHRISKFLSDRLKVKLQKSQDRLISTFSPPSLERMPVLVIQADRDEAAWYLNLVDWIAGLPYRLWAPRILFWFVWGFTFFILPWWLAQTHLNTFGGPFGGLASERRMSLEETWLIAFFGSTFMLLGVVSFLLVLSLGAQATMAIWAKIFRGHALGFGERNIVENWLMHITAASEPPNAKKIFRQSYAIIGSGLRHSLYDDDQVIERVANWIAKDT